jgi:hypothetical protein
MPNIKKPAAKRRDAYLCLRLSKEDIKLMAKYKKEAGEKRSGSTLMREVALSAMREYIKVKEMPGTSGGLRMAASTSAKAQAKNRR